MKNSELRTKSSDALHLLSCILGFGILLAVLVFFLASAGKAISPAFQKNTGAVNVNINYLFKTIRYTFGQSLASLLISLAVGLPAAFYTSKKSFAFRRFLLSFSAVPLCVPALIVALGYISTFGMAGIFNNTLQKLLNLSSPPLTFLYSFWGIAICQGFYNFPLIMATVGDAWSQLDTTKADSARLLGASEWRTFRTVTFYQLLPAIISACIPVFLYCFFSFLIVQLFGGLGGTTLEVSIYHAVKSTMNFKQAAILSIVETLCALFAVTVYTMAENKSASESTVNCSYTDRTHLTKKELPGFILAAILIAVFFLLPVLCIILQSFTCKEAGKKILGFANWKALFAIRGFLQALKNTLLTASGTALMCTVCGGFFAISLRLFEEKKGTSRISRASDASTLLLKTVPMIPMCISSVTMGFGILIAFRKGTPLLLVLCQTALYWPFAYRQIYAVLKKIPAETLLQARILSRNPLDAVFRIMIPYGKKGVLSALGFSFAISAGDATLPLVLGIQKFDTLGLFIYRLAGSYRLNEACAGGILLGSLCMVVFALTNRFKGGSR